MFNSSILSRKAAFAAAITPTLFLLVSSCATTRSAVGKATQGSLIVHGKLFTSFYQQRSAEYKALCIQSYLLARQQLDKALTATHTKPLAIITDIDETVLDNSKYAVHQGLQGKDYDQQSWTEWTARAEADTIAGARSFFDYASKRNVSIFYITNRNENERAGTLLNLQKYDFANADNDHLLLRQNTSGKEMRRSQVNKEYDVVLLLGDNLSDFSDLFDKASTPARSGAVEKLSKEFGSRFILLPNPVYGDWEGAASNYQTGLSLPAKDSVIRRNLRGY